MKMKKIYLACLSLLMTAGLVKVNAQAPISYGVKAELNMSNFFLSDLDDYSSRMKVGPNLGGFMKIDLHENFAIQPEVSFFYRTSKIKEEDSPNDKFKQWGMVIPVYAIGQTELAMGVSMVELDLSSDSDSTQSGKLKMVRKSIFTKKWMATKK
jgi:hypothetical protein